MISGISWQEEMEEGRGERGGGEREKEVWKSFVYVLFCFYRNKNSELDRLKVDVETHLKSATSANQKLE